MMQSALVLIGVSLLASAILTGIVRRYALAQRVLDVPNERSSHRTPTARGGGIAIVFAFALTAALAVITHLIPIGAALALVVPGMLVAAIGFVDDHRHVPPSVRLCVHLIAAFSVIVGIGGSPPLLVAGHSVLWGIPADVFAMLYIVWLLNLFNFMDGIDGIAGVEAVTVLGGGALLAGMVGDRPLVLLPLLLAAAAAGFLAWNFPPAKIFMGDVGSCFLGLSIAALSLLAGRAAPTLLWCWAILLGVFIVDASVTLIRRVIAGERFYEAHRSHAYQHAAVRLGGHKPVTLIVAGINLLWLLPLAVSVRIGWLDGFLGVLIAYAPLVLLTKWLDAGRSHKRVR